MTNRGFKCVFNMIFFIEIQCLKFIMDKTPKKLGSNCKQMLKKRLEMYDKVKSVR